MKNQSTNYSSSLPDELKRCSTQISVAKKPTYIYTEEDLGEGILEMSI